MSEVVLIVDDDPVQRRLLETMIQRFGYATILSLKAATRRSSFSRSPIPAIDGVILDLVMPDLDGLGVLAFMREAGLNIPVIVQTAHGGIDNVVSAMRAGATDFVVKPASPKPLKVSLRNALATRALAGELQRLKRRHEGTLTIADVITRSVGNAAGPQGCGEGRCFGHIGLDRRGIGRRQGTDCARDPWQRRAARESPSSQ